MASRDTSIASYKQFMRSCLIAHGPIHSDHVVCVQIPIDNLSPYTFLCSQIIVSVCGLNFPITEEEQLAFFTRLKILISQSYVHCFVCLFTTYKNT